MSPIEGLEPDPATPLPPDPPNDPVEPVPGGVEEPAPPESEGVDPITLPPTDEVIPPLFEPEPVAGPTYIEQERAVQNEAIAAAILDAESKINATPMGERVELYANIKTEVAKSLTQFVIADSPNGLPILLNGDREPMPVGEWVELNGIEVEQLRGVISKGECVAIIRPVGWVPKELR